MTVDQTQLELLLDENRIGILDGGLATYLEDGLDFDLSKGPLWSARLLDEKEDDVSNGKGCKGIHDAHLHYLQAGAGIVGTATYQASLESFARAQYAESSAKPLMTRAVEIASQALDEYASSQESRGTSSSTSISSAKPLISLSLGPYGGMLSNGAEYTGDYRKTYLPESDLERQRQPTLEEMTAFHQRRIEAFLSHPSWSSVGILALETVPRADEALAFRLALENISNEYEQKGKQLDKKPVYIAFAFQNDKRLPWPPIESESTNSKDEDEEMEELDEDGDAADEEMNWLIDIVAGTRVQGVESKWPLAGVGINCTKPYLLAKLVERMSTSLATLNQSTETGGAALQDARQTAGMERPLLFLYPDGGLLYDAVKKVWITPSCASQPAASDNSAMSWASNLMKLARDTASRYPVWRGVFVGGCCKSGTDEIRALCQCRAAP